MKESIITKEFINFILEFNCFYILIIKLGNNAMLDTFQDNPKFSFNCVCLFVCDKHRFYRLFTDTHKKNFYRRK